MSHLVVMEAIFYIVHILVQPQLQACESHDYDHQWTDYAMVWLS